MLAAAIGGGPSDRAALERELLAMSLASLESLQKPIEPFFMGSKGHRHMWVPVHRAKHQELQLHLDRVRSDELAGDKVDALELSQPKLEPPCANGWHVTLLMCIRSEEAERKAIEIVQDMRLDWTQCTFAQEPRQVAIPSSDRRGFVLPIASWPDLAAIRAKLEQAGCMADEKLAGVAFSPHVLVTYVQSRKEPLQFANEKLAVLVRHAIRRGSINVDNINLQASIANALDPRDK